MLGSRRYRGHDPSLSRCARGHRGTVGLHLRPRIERADGWSAVSRCQTGGGIPMTANGRIASIAQFGSTERQARFLVTVPLHAGVCMRPASVRDVRGHGVRSQGEHVLRPARDERIRNSVSVSPITARGSIICIITSSIAPSVNRTVAIVGRRQQAVRWSASCCSMAC